MIESRRSERGTSSEDGRASGVHRSPNRFALVIVGASSIFGAVGLGRFAYGAILPSMQEGLGLDNTAAGSLATWNLAGYVLMAVVGGLLASRFGTRLVVTVGLLVTGAGMILTGLATGLGSASAARALTGIGSGVVLVPSVAMMSAWFPIARRGLASGVAASGQGFGLVISGPLVPLIIGASGGNGWRLAWWVFGATCMALALPAAVVIRDKPSNLADIEPNEECDPRVHDWKGVYGSRFSWRLGLVYFLFGVGYMIYFTFFQRRIVGDLGRSRQEAGLLFMIVGLSSIFCGVIWGQVSDRIGRVRSLIGMLSVLTISIALFTFWPSTPELVLSSVLFGLSALSASALIATICGERFGALLTSVSLGFLTLFLGIGQAIGPLIAGWLADKTGSFVWSYAVAATAVFLGVAAALLLPHAVRAPTRGGSV